MDERLADWWQEFSLADEATREDLVQQARNEQQAKPRAPRVRRVPKADPTSAAAPVQRDAEEEADLPGLDGEAAPKKRRRRRRKPAGGGSEGGAAPSAE